MRGSDKQLEIHTCHSKMLPHSKIRPVCYKSIAKKKKKKKIRIQDVETHAYRMSYLFKMIILGSLLFRK